MNHFTFVAVVFVAFFGEISPIDLECGGAYEIFTDVGAICGVAHVTIAEPINFMHTEGNTIEAVKFFSCEVPIFPREVFAQFKHLRRVYLRNNKVNRIAEESFKKATALELLDLSANSLHKINATTFAGAVTLKTLHLEHNELEEIELGAFNDLKGLQSLYLGFNRLKKLDAGLFVPLEQLKLIHLYYSSLEIIDPQTFIHNGQLTDLDLEGNEIRHLDLEFSSKSLDVLDLSHCDIEDLTLK